MRRARNTRIDDLLRDRDLRSPDLLDREVQRPDLHRDLPLYEYRERDLDEPSLLEAALQREYLVWAVIIIIAILIIKGLFK